MLLPLSSSPLLGSLLLPRDLSEDQTGLAASQDSHLDESIWELGLPQRSLLQTLSTGPGLFAVSLLLLFAAGVP